MRRRRDERSMEERFLRTGAIGPESSRAAAAMRTRSRAAVAGLRYFALVCAAATAVAAVLGVAIGTATGHGALKSLVYGLWFGGGTLLVLGGAAGSGRGGGGIAARQAPGRQMLPGQWEPVGLILIGGVVLGIGVAIAVLFHAA